MCAKRHIVYSSVCWWPLTPYEYFLFIALEKTDYKVLHKVVFHLLLERTKTHTTPRWVPVNHRKPRPNGPLLYGLFDSHLLNAHHAALKRSLLRLSSLLPGNSWQHPAGKQLDKQPEPFSLFLQNQTVRKTKVFLLCRSRAVSMWNVLVSTQALRGVDAAFKHCRATLVMQHNGRGTSSVLFFHSRESGSCVSRTANEPPEESTMFPELRQQFVGTEPPRAAPARRSSSQPARVEGKVGL